MSDFPITLRVIAVLLAFAAVGCSGRPPENAKTWTVKIVTPNGDTFREIRVKSVGRPAVIAKLGGHTVLVDPGVVTHEWDWSWMTIPAGWMFDVDREGR